MAQAPTSLSKPGGTKRAEISLLEPLTPGCETLCRTAWTRPGLQKTSGTRGLRTPVELSQNKLLELLGTEITEREDEFFMVVIEEQDCCRKAIMKKSKLGTEKSGAVVGELFKTGLQGTETGLGFRMKLCLTRPGET